MDHHHEMAHTDMTNVCSLTTVKRGRGERTSCASCEADGLMELPDGSDNQGRGARGLQCTNPREALSRLSISVHFIWSPINSWVGLYQSTLPVI